MTETNQHVAGFYGKVPTHGDFVSRRLPRGFLDPWDRWLQAAIAGSREQLAEHWLDIYLTSPIWRFVLSAGVCDDLPWVGVVMPSVDRVGRYYPFTLAQPLPREVNPLEVLWACEWFERFEVLVLSCLQDGFDLEAFDLQVQALSSAGEIVPRSSALLPKPEVRSRDAWRFALDAPRQLFEACPSLVQQLLGEVFFAYSLWWTGGSDRVQASLLICQGLPPVDGFAALLSGDWPQSGWQDRTLKPAPASPERQPSDGMP